MTLLLCSSSQLACDDVDVDDVDYYEEFLVSRESTLASVAEGPNTLTNDPDPQQGMNACECCLENRNSFYDFCDEAFDGALYCYGVGQETFLACWSGNDCGNQQPSLKYPNCGSFL